MPIEVNLAKLSPTMETGQLVRWAVKVGDKVKEGDILAEIQTDKAVMPMEAFDEGVVAILDVKEGDEIALGQRVLVLAKTGEDFKQIGEQLAKGGAAKQAPPTAASVASSGVANGQAGASTTSNAPVALAEAAPASPGGRIRSSPLARKVASTAGVEIGRIPGTGPNGRIVRSDVEAFLKNPAASKPASGAEAPRPNAVTTPAPGETKRVPHSPMRKTIAKRMLEAKAAAPEIHVTVDIRLDKVMAVRETLNAQLAPEKIKLSVGDFITKAVAVALRRHPGLNASYEVDALVYHPEVNVGIAVAMEGGLMVPVLHRADTLGLREIRQGTEALATATRSGKLKPTQMMGGTFTISNLGMYGVKHFDAILNLPEVAILAVGAGEKRPVVEGNALVVGTVMTVTLTADHRAVDGALAAEFLRTLKGLLEEPATMLL